jgi:predicted nuclease of predicted toxin-antitoxin system
MRLLFDENLSPALVRELSSEYPQSVHVREVGLASATDSAVWNFALREGLAIVSKDDDFRQRSFLLGAPPKVIALMMGNVATAVVADLLRQEMARVRAFLDNANESMLLLP